MNADGSAPVALVIEDDEQIAFLVRFILQKEGYAVRTASDGLKARGMIESDAAPALVTLDFMLPNVHGLELLEAMRASESWREVPVLMLTAKSQQKDIARALELGADGYVIKPFKPEELRVAVRGVVKRGGS